jgi:hypothetical protein
VVTTSHDDWWRIEFISIKLQMLVKPSESGITAKCCEPLCLLA